MYRVTELIAGVAGARGEPRRAGGAERSAKCSALMYSKYWRRRGASGERWERGLGAPEFPDQYLMGAVRASREETDGVSVFLQPALCPPGSQLCRLRR